LCGKRQKNNEDKNTARVPFSLALAYTYIVYVTSPGKVDNTPEFNVALGVRE